MSLVRHVFLPSVISLFGDMYVCVFVLYVVMYFCMYVFSGVCMP